MCKTQLVAVAAPRAGLSSPKVTSLFSGKHFKMTNFTVVAEGIADDKVSGLLADQLLADPHLCLFRIETLSSRALGAVSRTESKLENRANKASFEKSQGQPLKFGQQVQLRHVHSGRFLSLNLLTAAETPGAWSVSVSMPSAFLCRKISLLPFTRSHNFGDAIKCEEVLSIAFHTDNLKYYLQAEVVSHRKLQIHSTHKPASWRFTRFETYNESTEAIKYGLPMTIKYAKLGVGMALKKDKYYAKAISGQIKNSDGPHSSAREVIVTKGEVEDFSHFWILQNVNVMKGGCVKWNSKFYIKSAVTGEFLGANMALRERPDPTFFFTFPKPESFHEDSVIPYEYPLLMKSSDGRVLSIDQKKSNEEALDHLVPVSAPELHFNSGEISVVLEPLGVDKRESLFTMNCVSEANVKFFNFVKALLPKFVKSKAKLESFMQQSESSGRTLWETSELLEGQLQSLRDAMKYVQTTMRETLGEEQTAKQNIVVGLKLHAVLIEIAGALHAVFGDSKPPAYAKGRLRTLVSETLCVLWDLLSDAVLENSFAAKIMTEHQLKLCELLKYDTVRIGGLLTETFRLVDPEIKDPKSFYHEWCNRLQTLTRQNLTEQVIYLKIIRNLCEIDDVGVLEYQREVAWHLYHSEIAFDIITFTQYLGEVAVKFGEKCGTVGSSEFKLLNPDLSSKFHENVEGQAVVLLSDLSSLADYVEYVQAALMLYHCICSGKCEFASQLAASRNGLTVPVVFAVSQSLFVPISIRQACLFLLEALCIAAAPYEPYTETDTSFSYADIKLSQSHKAQIPLFTYDPEAPYISKVLKFVFEFWMQPAVPSCLKSGHLTDAVKFVRAMLRITQALVEFQHCTELYAHCMLKAMLYALAGFTDAAKAYKSQHWATDLISAAIKEGHNDRNLNLVVNDLLACVLSTILAVKKISRKSLLWHAVCFLTSKPAVFRAHFMESGLGVSQSLEEVTNGLKELLDTSRANRLITEFVRSSERNKGENSSQWELSVNTSYSPDFDIHEISQNAPPLKEAFVRVILEWSSFSPFLKDKMLETMNEIFKENTLFAHSFKNVDIYSLGPLSEMHNRLRWLKEHAEVESLLVKARFESSLAGKTTSLTRITNLLEYVTNFVHPAACKHEFVLRKTQNIVRHLELHVELFKLWGLLHYLDKIGKGLDSPSVRLKSAFAAFLYYFTRENPKNAKELSKLLKPHHYLLTVSQFPAFLRILNDFAHLTVRDFTRLMVHILDEALASDKALCMFPLMECVMVDKYGDKKKTYQSIVSTLLSERVADALKAHQSRPSYISKLIHYLALSAEDNGPVIAQCRYLLPLSQLQDLVQRDTNTELLGSALFFLYAVYIKKTGDVKTLETAEDIEEILQKVLAVARNCMEDPGEVLKLVAEGSYPCVYFTTNPAYTEVRMNSPCEVDSLQRWKYIYQEWDGRGAGVMRLLPDLLASIQLNVTIHRHLADFYQASTLCLGKIQHMAEQFKGTISFHPLITAFEGCHSSLLTCFHSLDPSFLFSPVPCDLCPIPDSEILRIRSILRNSYQFPTLTCADEDASVDEQMAKVMKTGYLHYKKTFFVETEEEYIATIVRLIDQRLLAGRQFSKKEIKEAIPALLRKIKRLQRLFTSSKQRTLFFRILQGIVPKEEHYALKIQLNPLFQQAEVTSLALQAVMRMESVDEVNAALLFLRKLFLMQSREFMDEFREDLSEGSNAYPLLIQIQKELEVTKSDIVEKAQTQYQKRISTPNLSVLSHLLAKLTSKGRASTLLKSQHMVINMLLFVQLCCDNCNEPFQVFFRTQQNKEGKADVDMVSALASFLVDIRIAKDFLISNKEVFQVLDAALSVLVDFVTGPCASNQHFLGNNVHLYLAINMLIGLCQDRPEPALIGIHKKSIQFLCTLLEGKPDPSIPETMSRFLDLALLRTGCESVYQHLIVGNETLLSLESGDLTEPHRGIVEAALSQAILLVQLRSVGIIHDELTKFEGSTMEPTPTFAYFSRYIGYVEIDRNGALESHYFPIPWKCKYITSTTRLSLVFEVNRSSHQEKIEDFISRIKLCQREMVHQQHLHGFAAFKRMSGRWQLFGKVSYYLALIINMVLLGSIQEPDFGDLKGNLIAFTAVAILGVMQIMAYMACFFFNIIEYYPKTVMSGIRKPIELEMNEFPVFDDSDSQMMHKVHSGMQTRDKLTYSDELKEKLKQVLLNFDMYYTYGYFMVSIIAVYEPVFYPLLLLDMIQQTPELANVLKSVTLNFRQLILTMWLGVIIIYLFSIVAFVYYNSDFASDSVHCTDLWNCFFTTLNVGIRSGGGIGDGLEIPDGEEYWSRMIFDMLFYMVIIIILLNIVFGIIIDTFAELRDQRNLVLEDIHSKCYVCGQDRSLIEMKGTGWSYHFMCEHSAFAYLSFLVYICEKKTYDCCGLEKHVKERLEKNDASFMPSTSLAMERDS